MRLSLACLVCFTTSLAAQYSTDFESLTASPSGTAITGQDGYYIPVPGSIDGTVFTYAGNTLGVPTNPNGGDNFYAGVVPAAPVACRAQRPVEISQHSIVRIESEVLIDYGFSVPGTSAGISLQPGGSVQSNIVALPGAVPGTWDFYAQDPAGIILIPDPAFTGLATNVWHRWGVTVDIQNGVYVDFTITNGATNVTTVYTPPTPIALLGVPGPAPTEYRLFTGGSDFVFAVDNVSVTNPQSGQYSTDFEYMNATPAGTVITGQDGYYIPVPGSIDGNVFTYANNTLGVPTNPAGGEDFYAGVVPTAPVACRAQRPITLPPDALVHIESDVLISYGFSVPGTSAGISLQPGGSVQSNIVALPGAVPGTWDFYAQDPAGIILIPDPAFTGLATNVWHRWGVTVDIQNGVYVDFTITNGATNVTTVYAPPTPIALIGAPGPAPTEYRLFTGGSDFVFAVDNLVITYGASYDTFGSGCAGSLGVPTLSAVGGASPRLGTAFQVELGNLPNGTGIIASGFSDTITSNSSPLPLDLGANGFPGCFLLVDPLIAEFVAGSGNTATWTFAVPMSGVFAGVTYYQQGLSLDTVTPAGAAFSNAGRLQIGY